MKKAILAAAAALVALTMSACGGGGNPNPPNNPTVTVSPATANVQEAGQQQFTATVSNTSDTTVTWQVNSITGGNAAVGTITSSGLYTAPASIPSPASVTITAFISDTPSISGNAIATITPVTFNNSSLKGNYIMSFSGVDSSGNSFYAIGAITADGNGNITGGEEDLNDVTSGYFTASSLNGSYSIGADGRGTLNINNSIGNFQFAIAMKALDNAVLNEIDNTVVAATGNLEAQLTTPAAAPSGNYAFGFTGSGLGCGSFASAGVFALSGGNVGGVQDLNCGGNIVVGQGLTGSYGGVDGLGRGTGSFTGSSSGSSNMIYYVISGNRFRFLCPDPATFFLGSADLQTQSSFSPVNFSGQYVINTSANTSAGVSYTLISINANGGNVSTGYYDVNDTGTVGQASLTGAYNVGSNGYVSGNWSVNGVALPYGIYLISPTQGYYVDERSNAIGGGNIYAQDAALTTNAAWAGSYATKQFGYFVTGGVIGSQNASGVSGQISADGNGNLAGTLDVNDPTGVVTGATLQGTYSVGSTAPGRLTASITNQAEQGSRNYVGYVVSSGQVLLLETDSNLVSAGDAIRQF